MDLSPLFQLVDAKPFRVFDLELVSGRRVPVSHPENVHFIPARHRVGMIVVVGPAMEDYSILYPESIAAYHLQGAADAGTR